jgi:radial spoke head protein 3
VFAGSADLTVLACSMNIMFDPRVRRGTTVAHMSQTADSPDNSTTVTRRRVAPRAVEVDPFAVRATKPDAPAVDLSPFLVDQAELRAKPVPTAVMTQTDEFEDLPPPPPFIPPKSGVDAAVQVEPTELFNFNLESAPLVEVITAKTLEQALLEVQEEAELEGMLGAEHELREQQTQERRRIRKLDENAQEKQAASAAAVALARRRARAAQQCREKVLSCALARGLVRGGHQAAIATLRARLMFQDPVRSEVDKIVLPAVEEGAVGAGLAAQANARRLVDSLLSDALGAQRKAHAAEMERQKRLAEEQERKKPYLVTVLLRGVMPDRDEDELVAADDEGDDESKQQEQEPLPEPGTHMELSLGPILIARVDSVAQVERRIREWISTHPSKVVDALLRGRELRLAHDGVVLDGTRTLESMTVRDLQRLHLVNQPIGQ